jgi:hypothetical protein
VIALADDPRAVAAAAYLIAAKASASGKDWPAPAVEGVLLAAIGADGARLEDLLASGLAVATDPTATAPSNIRRRARPTGPAGPSEPRCRVCGRPETACRTAAAKVPETASHSFMDERGSR